MPAQGYYKDQNGRVNYRPLWVERYDSETKLFEVKWMEDDSIGYLNRIYFCLDAEDPRKYAKRVANAFKERNNCDSTIRYNFYIDNMPQ